MNLTVSGHHVIVSRPLRIYVLNKLEPIKRHFGQIVGISVLLSIESLREKERRQKAEVNLRIKGRDIFLVEVHENMYAAIDQLMDKLDRQVLRHKARLLNHNHIVPKRLDFSAA